MSKSSLTLILLLFAAAAACSAGEPAKGSGQGIGGIGSGGNGGNGGGNDTPALQVREGAITLDRQNTLRTYEGLGALVSYGKLLYDYPEPQRSEIMDYLFLPNYGASLQILKVEIGSDGNNTAMAWPSHRRTQAEANDFTRGYSWWYMKEAKKRNPDIILSALNWGWPAWTKTDQQKADFIVDYVEGAWKTHGLRINYIGGNQNESDITPSITKLIRSGLNARGFSDVKIICADEGAKKARYEVLDFLASDSAYRDVVDVIGVHYKSREADFMPEVTYSYGKPLWSTEDGGGAYNSPAQGNNWTAQLMKLFIDVKMTAAIRWLATASIYANMPWPNNGIMRTKEPWCGHYVIGANLWSFAHFTQFIKPGWKQLSTSTTYIIPGTKLGRFIAFCDSATGDYSIVLDAHDSSLPAAGADVVFKPEGGLSTGAVYVWASDFTGGDWFSKAGTIVPDRDGYITFKVTPGHVYTLSTTTGQNKGTTSPPAKSGFPTPYSDDFESYAPGTQARYFVDANSIFEIAQATGRSGKVLRQVIREAPQMWHPNSAHPFQPVTEIGGMEWTDYAVSVDILLENEGKAVLGGRIDAVTENTGDYAIQGYWLTYDSGGAWTLRRRDTDSFTTLASGSVSSQTGTGVWTSLALEFSGSTVKASIGGTQVASCTDATYSAGNVILGTIAPSVNQLHKYTSTYCTAQFDNFSVR